MKLNMTCDNAKTPHHRRKTGHNRERDFFFTFSYITHIIREKWIFRPIQRNESPLRGTEFNIRFRRGGRGFPGGFGRNSMVFDGTGGRFECWMYPSVFLKVFRRENVEFYV